MELTLTALPLDSNGADILERRLGKRRSNQCVDALIQHALDLGASYAVLEEPYTDVDYSADYQAIYAGAFKSYPRHTERLHLFSRDVSDVLERSFKEQAEARFDEHYLGFVVIRPISQGPIGRTVLRFPHFDNLVVRCAARAKFRSHIAGAELEIVGAPFIQQETKVGACAQAAIWMAGLAVHSRHRTPRYTMADITRLATTPTDAVLSQALPAGSDGLNPAHMIRALSGMGHQPLFEVLKHAGAGSGDSDRDGAAADKVLRYLDSGLPVILNLEPLMHAVTAVGYVETPGAAVTKGDTYEAFARALLVHDDQRGPYRLMPLRQSDIAHLPDERLLKHGGRVITVEEEARYMFVPLPSRVLLSAERADIVARDFLEGQARDMAPNLIAALEDPKTGLPKAVPRIKKFYEDIRAQRIIRRTYLTSAARFRHHLSKGNLVDSVKKELLGRTLPHYVWVTELLDRSAKPANGGARPIIGQIVVNATSTSDPDNDILMVHTPYLVMHRDLEGDENRDFTERLIVVDTDRSYSGRVRRH